MTEFQERHFSNGNSLKNFQRQKVSCFVKVESVLDNKFKAKTTDDKSLLVFCNDVPAREGDWVEVIGTPRGQEQFAADEIINFANGGVEFDAESHNYMIQVLNNADQVFNLQ
ncbi:hypothetical protein ACFFRR_003551 [Megaselia abdita]